MGHGLNYLPYNFYPLLYFAIFAENLLLTWSKTKKIRI